VILLLAVVIPAACYDLKYRRIPNWLSVAGAVLGVCAHWATEGVSGLKVSLAGFLIAFTLYFVLYLLHAMGAGDVKLMAAVGAIAGFRWWVAILVFTGLAGAFLALCLAARKRRLGSTLWNVAYLMRELISLRRPWLTRSELDVKNPETLRLPHAVSIATGAVVSLVLLVFRP
jgi:prepilin peptidase CpaA